MTKKDYKAITKVLSEVYENSNTTNELDNLGLIINGLIAIFKRDNPRFDTSKFVDAIDKHLPGIIDIDGI